ncbi:unnamed protein product, partial [Brassica oleracea]
LNEILYNIIIISRSGLKILITGKEGKPKTKTLNVVYKQIFQNIS